MSETPRQKNRHILGLSCGVPFLGCLGIIAAVIVVVIALALMAGAGQNAATDQAIVANAGRGLVDNPIPAGDWLTFKGGRVRATRMIRPANAEVERMNMFNDDAPVGADYILIWFELECQQAKCNPAADLSLHLIDPTGKAWGEPFFLVLTENLDGAEALRGRTIAGWQGFEYPEDEPIGAVRVRWGAETLHTGAPAP